MVGHFNPAESSYFNQGFLNKNFLKGFPRKRGRRNTRDKISAKEAKNISLNDLKEASPPTKRPITERCTLTSKKIARNAEKSSDGTRLLQRDLKRAPNPPVTGNVKSTMALNAKKTPEDTPKSVQAESRPIVRSVPDERLSV